MGPTDLYALALEYLQACQDALSASPGGPVGYAYVAPGPPAWDCEQLTVYVGGPVVGDTLPLQPPLQPSHRIAQTGEMLMVQMVATVLRCAPVTPDGSPAPSSEWDATSQVTLGDVWAIWNGLRHAYLAETLFPPVHAGGSKREFRFDPAVPIAISGGLAGWQVPVTVNLPGY